MATPSRRTQANKQNALKSTGPRTKAGKAASSVNAVQHGILSRHLILPSESRDEFDALLQQLMGEQQPVGTLEQALVERLAVALWCQRRLVAAETAQLQLQQAELTGAELMRVKQIIGEASFDVIKSLAGEPSTMLADVQADVDACKAWLVDREGDESQDLASLPRRLPRLWTMLATELEVDNPTDAAPRILGAGNSGLYAWVVSTRLHCQKLLDILTALQQTRQAALQPREADVLSRYQSSLDNDLYKAVRVLRETQRHRIEQAALTAKPIVPMGSKA